MKLKGVSALEQHVEKLVLLIFALFAVGVFVMQFDIMGDPNAVTIENEQVPPERAVEVVKQRALRLKGQMEGEGLNVELPEQPGPLAAVRAVLEAPIAPEPGGRLALAPAWSSEGYESPRPTEGPDITLGNAYKEITPPAPTGVMARAFAGTIDPVEPVLHPELSAFLPEQQPLDKRAVTVQATFDAAALRSLLSTVPEDESVNPLPAEWWQGRVEVLDVELIRQEAYDDGTFGPEETVPALPGRFSLRDQIRSEETAPKDLPTILRGEADHREEIRRPAFYRMIMGEEWVWPGLAAERASEHPQQREINRLVSQYRKLAQEKERVEKRLEAIGNIPTGPSERPPGPQRGQAWPSIPPTWLAQMPGPGGGRPGGEQDESERRREQSKQQQIKALQERLAALTEEMAKIESELKDTYGVGVDGQSLGEEEIPVFTEAATSLTGPDAPASVTVWAHDIGVEPNGAYRYKVRVWTTNPLFGHVADVPEPQRALASRPAIASAESAWSEPVRAYPERVFFVSSAIQGSAGGALGIVRGASASVEAYEFYYGYWRGGSVSLDQGDMIRVDVTLPELPVFEVEVGEQGEPLVNGKRTLPTERVVSQDALLLDVGVALGAGGRGEVREAIFGWLDGELEVRVAEADAETSFAEMVWVSSEASKTAEVREPGTGASRRGGSRREDGGERPLEAPRGPDRRPGLSPGGG